MREGDELVGVRHSSGTDDVLMVSKLGQAIRFNESNARAMGRDASGVQGMRLRGDDEVISINIAQDDADLLVVTENGYGKRTRVADYPLKGRGGMGVKTIQLTEAKGKLAGARVVRDGYQVMLISTGGTVIRMPVEDVKRLGRSTQGVIVMRLRGDETRLGSRSGRRLRRRLGGACRRRRRRGRHARGRVGRHRRQRRHRRCRRRRRVISGARFRQVRSLKRGTLLRLPLPKCNFTFYNS